ncbi:uncharacterized protein LOC128222138 [Mya arenaria]|uniref:uncharacterized protein LOC128222138 n=1 Tax=Mya arenaria TaxID=6604 RepID=UPI0022DF25B7|nr:uncharacterized protein LOC128222138 [Mya arenaria]
MPDVLNRKEGEMTAQYHYSSSSQSLIDIAEEYAACARQINEKKAIAKAVGIVKFKSSDIVHGHHKVLWNKNGRTFDTKNCVHLELETMFLSGRLGITSFLRS